MRVSRLVTNRRLFILLVSVILLIVIGGLTLRDRGRATSWPERIIMDVENTVGGWIYRPVAGVSSFFSGIHDLHEMYVENAQLKAEVQNYAALNAQLRDATQQIDQLNKMLDFKQTSDGQKLKPVPAHVVGRDPSTWNSEITIDAGLREGIQQNMAVVSSDGSLVGRVSSVADNSAKVVLITDTEFGDGISARVQSSGNQPFGIVTGSSTVAGKLEMDFISPVSQVKVGDTVVTSNLSKIYPEGILIGTVSKMLPGMPGLTQSVLIQPAADLDYLQNVFVVGAK